MQRRIMEKQKAVIHCLNVHNLTVLQDLTLLENEQSEKEEGVR